MLENIERHGTRFARVHVPGVFARPAERLAGNTLHPFRINLARLPEIEFRGREIVADDPNEFDRRKEARAERGVGSGPAHQVGVFFQLEF